MKKILVTGANGLVGSRFVELYSKKYEIIAPNFPEFDLTQKESVKKVLSQYSLDVIVHLAAYTNVSEAENQRNNKDGDCWKINVDGTKNLLSLIKGSKVHFIYISTDYVFSGSKENPGPYAEDAIPEKDSNKVTWYGFTKSEAERAVNKNLSDKRTILRIIYPVRAKYSAKADYLRKPLSLFDQGKLYPMFTDQTLTISFIDEVSLCLEKIIEKKAFGIFHCSSPDTTSPHKLISYLIERARGVKNAVKSTTLDEFIKNTNSSLARYPKYGGLKVEKTQKILGIKYKTTREIIDELVKQGIS